jgi:hypothetical protein
MNKYHTKMYELFAAAEPELRAVAERHGFSLRLTEQRETWYFYPEVSAEWEEEQDRRAATLERFRDAATRSLDAIKHCRYKMNDNEAEVDKRMRNTSPLEWTVSDMNTTINTDMKINHPFIRSN